LALLTPEALLSGPQATLLFDPAAVELPALAVPLQTNCARTDVVARQSSATENAAIGAIDRMSISIGLPICRTKTSQRNRF
jgi:hypothetical protein